MKKKLSLTAIVISISVFIFIFYGIKNDGLKKQNKTKNEIKTKVEDILNKHHHDGIWLIKQIESLPSEFTINDKKTIKWDVIDPINKYVHSSKLKEILFSLGTLIHESSHIYHSRAFFVDIKEKNLDAEINFKKYYLKPEEQFLVKTTDTFPAKEISSLIPLNAKTERFEEYIYPSEIDMGTQKDGIFGLVDEWVAYYQGLQTEQALINYVYSNKTQIKKSELNDWLNYASIMSDNYLAYFEFKLYILSYLYTAQKKYPVIYQKLSQNEELKSTLSKSDISYQTLLTKYLKIRSQFIFPKGEAFMKDLKEKEKVLKLEINKPIYKELEETFMKK